MYLEFKIIYGIELNWADAHQKKKLNFKPTIVLCVIDKYNFKNKIFLLILWYPINIPFHQMSFPTISEEMGTMKCIFPQPCLLSASLYPSSTYTLIKELSLQFQVNLFC